MKEIGQQIKRAAQRPATQETAQPRPRLVSSQSEAESLNDHPTLLDGQISIRDPRISWLTRIIAEYWEGCQFQPMEAEDLLNRALAWKTITMPVPSDRLYEAYAYAVQNRNPERLLRAEELCFAWRQLQAGYRSAGEDGGQRMLAANSSAGCDRCYGTGMEVVPEKGARRCSHDPLSEAERKAREDALAARGALRPADPGNVAAFKPKEAAAALPGPANIICSDCRREEWLESGWQIGDRCGAILDPQTIKICGGRWRERIRKGRKHGTA